jgi:acyl-CoA thioesterase FadM
VQCKIIKKGIFMYPVFRVVTSSIQAALSKTMSLDSIFKTTFRCMPWDLDLFFEMNNGRVLTLYDLGRFSLTIQSGLLNTLFKKKWGVVVAGSCVRYRRRIRLFDKVTIHTQIAGFEGRWIYITQSMWVKNKPVSSVLLRTGITGKGKTISTDEIRNLIDIPNWNPELPKWVKSWIESEQIRPWPPLSNGIATP